jgi:glycosyltransferase involved in cell wall biosynthesis
LKIIHITPSYKPAYIYGGPTLSVSKLCEALTYDHDSISIEVLTTTANGKSELDLEVGKRTMVEGVSVQYFNRWTKDHTHFSPSLLKELRAIILQYKNKEPLIIHIHSWWNLVAIFSCLIAYFYRIPTIVSPRGMISLNTLTHGKSFLKRIIHYTFGKKLISNVFLHATSEKEKNDLSKIVATNSISTIPNLVSFDVQNMEGHIKSSRNKSLKIIYLSRIDPIKGIEILFNSLSKTTIPWTLTLAGDGHKDYIVKLKEKTKELGINENINWIGQVDNTSKFNLLANHDILVLTSLTESFANIVIESLSVGTSVLVSNQVGLADYVRKNDLGYVTRLEPKDIANQLTLAYQSESYLKEIRTKAPDMIRKDFNKVSLAKQYIQLYRKVLEHKNSNP